MNTHELLLFYVKTLRIPVFPVIITQENGKSNKKPAVQWGKYQTELPTDEDLAIWAERYTSFGMPTGELSRIVVVDVDMDQIEEAEAILGIHLHSSMMVKTISGGTHIYYKWDSELRNTVKLEGAPIDFRGDGGFVVIPSSFDDKSPYKWLREPTDLLKTMLPELPKEIKNLLTLNKTRVKISLTNDEESSKFSDGERNAASVVAIRKLLGDIPQSNWGTTGWYAFYHWCTTFCSPPLDEYQIKATFNWWVRSNAKDANVQGQGTLQTGLERIEERVLERTAPTTGYEFLDQKIKGWIPGHLYVFTGDTNAGKSAAACNFIYRVFQQGKKTAYFALEPDVGVMEYIAGIHHRKRWDEIKDEDLKLDLPGVTIFTKDDKMNLDILVKTIQTMDRQDLIIVDHIGYFTNDSGDKRSKTDQESNAIKKIVGAAKKKKSAILIIAHPRKPAGNSKKKQILTMNDISGSASFKQDGTDIMILDMDKDESDPYGLTNLPTGRILLPKVKTGKSGTVNIRFIPDSPVMVGQDERGYESVQTVNYDGEIVEPSGQAEMKY